MRRAPSAAANVGSGGATAPAAVPVRCRHDSSRSEDLGGGLVDQADAIVRVDHQEALAQVLHDVLRQLREIGEIHFLAAHQGFALAQAVGHWTGGERHQEHGRAEYAGGDVVGSG
jgi:hypothetical protein